MLQIKKDYVIHIDVQPGDVLFQYTTVRPLFSISSYAHSC